MDPICADDVDDAFAKFDQAFQMAKDNNDLKMKILLSWGNAHLARTSLIDTKSSKKSDESAKEAVGTIKYALFSLDKLTYQFLRFPYSISN
jgi:hypothetical protein